MGNAKLLPGYRVVIVEPNSPAWIAKLEEYFDFIIEIDNTPIVDIDQSLSEFVQSKVGQQVCMKVYNTRVHESRIVSIRPHAWKQNKNEGKSKSLLGAMLRFENFDPYEKIGLMVGDVLPGSPAEMSGLHPLEDFILGTRL